MNRRERALSSLGAAGFTADHLYGDEGRAQLSMDADDGITAVVQRLVLAFGDEARIHDLLEDALANGASVVSVDVESDQAPEVARILQEHGGHDMWRLGEWRFNQLGEKGPG